MWLSYFNTPMSTMLPYKRNMCLETIGALFLFTRSDVSEGRRINSDPNEQNICNVANDFCGFNMEQMIIIVQKKNFCMEYIFESDISVSI